MGRQCAAGTTLVILVGTLLLVPTAAAQQQASGIAGTVRDSSGGVMPGVTVEASSPALIEKIRTSTTDDKGEYKILDLRPGVYAVTFTLTGFSTVKREGLELPIGFTATVNTELRVGSLEETITVSGLSPLVDTQTVRQQTSVSSVMLETLPTSTKTIQTLVALTPGFSTRAGTADVGGSAGTYAGEQNTGAFHGKVGNKRMFDGMRTNNMETDGSSTGFLINPLSVQEMTVETSGTSAESAASSVLMNMIPKDGGNTFRGGLNLLYTNHNLQSDNLNDELRGRGLATTNKVDNIRDLGGTFGGPVKIDRLWFFTAQRFYHGESQIAGQFYNKTHGTMFYTPDLTRPMLRLERFRSHVLRLTWQASPKNKINAYGEVQDNWMHRHTFSGGLASPEAISIFRFAPQALYQLTWSSPVTNKLLLEAGAGTTISHWPNYRETGVTPDLISITELSTGLRYNAQFGVNLAAYGNIKRSDRFSQRASMSYVTGSHAVKVGIQLDEGIHDNNAEIQGPLGVAYRFLNGVPSALVEDAVPFRAKELVKPELGLYLQDQWKLNRLTINAGLRFDYLNAYVPEQHVPAGPFVPARDFPRVNGVPSWKDLNPRLGGSYDLFGNGRTAVKASFGRYLGLNQADIARLNNPMVTSVNEVTRTWTDSNANFSPDCDLFNPLTNGECGQISDLNFGKLNITTRYADDVIRGFGARDHTWDISTSVQHEVVRGLSLTAGYYRNWFRNFRVTDNLAVTPTDFSPYCITAPSDSRLPGGGGYQVCGLYDIAPARFGIVNNLVTQASHYGEQTRASDFISLSVNGRLPSGVTFGGGLDTGRTVDDNCFTIDSPQQLLNCHIVTPFSGQTQVKLHGAYPLPYNFVVSAVYQRVPGPVILANYPALNAVIAPSLGRNLAACGSRVPCTSTATVPLVVPQTQFEDARSQLDIRMTKILKLSGRARIQANVDIYNLLNASSILIINTNYGSQWRRPTSILDGRLMEFSAQLSF